MRFPCFFLGLSVASRKVVLLQCHAFETEGEVRSRVWGKNVKDVGNRYLLPARMSQSEHYSPLTTNNLLDFNIIEVVRKAHKVSTLSERAAFSVPPDWPCS